MPAVVYTRYINPFATQCTYASRRALPTDVSLIRPTYNSNTLRFADPTAYKVLSRTSLLVE